MLETAAMLVAGYAGYAAWPWWTAAIIGACAGLWNAITRLHEKGIFHDLERLKTFAPNVIPFTMAVSALLFCGIYFAVRFMTGLFS